MKVNWLTYPMASASGEENTKAAGRVALHRLFVFADRTDAALMAVGAVAAVANGMAQPLMTLIFGDVIDAFGSGITDGVVHRVVQVRNNLATTTCFIVVVVVIIDRFGERKQYYFP